MTNRILAWILGTIVVFALAWAAIVFLAPFIAGGAVVYVLARSLRGPKNQVRDITPRH
jgi:hypothetical protein